MKKCMLAVATVLGAFALFGETLTWKGGGTDSLMDENNWEPAQAPAPGDVLKFTKAATIGVGSGAIDVGTSGLTFEIASGVTLITSFKLTGSGVVTKTGAGIWNLKHTYANRWTTTGDVVINNGEITLEAGGNSNAGSSLGSGEIVVNRTATAYPIFHLRSGYHGFKAIRITGPFTPGKSSIDWNGSSDIVCPIYSPDDDFIFHHDFGRNKYFGGIYAAGHTMYVDGFEWCPVSAVWFDCKVEASLDLGDKTSRNYYLNEVVFGSNFRLTDPDATITIRKVGAWASGDTGTGKVEFYSGSMFYGKLITTSECPEVVVQGSTTFVKGFGAMELAAATKLTIADGKKVTVYGFKQGETTLDLGTYAWDTGAQGWVAADAGPLAVVPKTNLVIYTGPAETASDWQDAACWQNGKVPAAGDYVLIDKTCALTWYDASGASKEFDISAGGITLDIGANVGMLVKFTGTGALTKEGAGTMFLRNGMEEAYLLNDQGAGTSKSNAYLYQNTYTGGTYIRNGRINVQTGASGTAPTTMSSLGTGPVYIVRQPGVNPDLRRRTGYTSGFGPFYIQGPMVNGKASILWNSTSSIDFPIYAEDDFGFGITYGTITFNGPIYAHGHTMKLAYEEYTDSDAIFNSLIDATMIIGDNNETYGMRNVTFGSGFALINPATTITAARAKTVTFNAGAKLCGTYVNKAPAKVDQALTFKGSGTYVGNLTIEDTAQLTASGASVSVGGTLKADAATYTEGTQTIAGGTFALVPAIAYNFWTGAVDNDWSNGANWGRGTAAKGGDRAVFKSYITKIEASEPVDITGDLTIEVVGASTIVNSLVKFVGDGKLIKEGAGRFSFGKQDTSGDKEFFYLPLECYPTYTGHTVINDGALFFFAQELATFIHLPYVEVNRAANTSPMLYHRSGRCDYDEIHVNGAYVAGRPVIDVNGVGAHFGPVYATDDIDVLLEYSQIPFTSFYLGGKAAHFYGSWSSTGIGLKLNGVLEGDCIVGKTDRAFGQVLLGSGFKTTGSVTVTRATELKMDAGATIGTALAMNATDGAVTLADRDNLAKTATLEVNNGSTLNIPAKTYVRVTQMKVDETALANGSYTKTAQGGGREFLTGDGTLMVGPPVGITIVVY